MKKFISILLVLFLLLAVSGCGEKNNPKDSSKEPPTNETQTKVPQTFEDLEKMPAFSCEDIVTGNQVTDKVLGDYKLTIINIWSTT